MTMIFRALPACVAAVVIIGAGGLIGHDLWAAWQTTEPPAVPAPIRTAMQRAEAAPAKAQAEVTNFVLFHEVKVDGVGSVVTGARFTSVSATSPETSWCYVRKDSGPAHAGRILTLANRTGDGPVEPAAVSPEAAADFGTTPETLDQARSACRFGSG